VSAVAPAMLISEIEIQRKERSRIAPPACYRGRRHNARENAIRSGGGADAALAIAALPQSTPQDPLLRAMLDETGALALARIAGLMERPYFIEYSIEDARIFNVSATLGSLMGSSLSRARVPQWRCGPAATSSTTPTTSTPASTPGPLRLQPVAD